MACPIKSIMITRGHESGDNALLQDKDGTGKQTLVPSQIITNGVTLRSMTPLQMDNDVMLHLHIYCENMWLVKSHKENNK